MKLDKDFLWGAATAAYQVEGGNVASDWWTFEHAEGAPMAEPSGDSVDHYHRYREDIALLSGLGLNAFRLGIEWSRIEPAPGQISYAAIDHYRRVLDTCAEHGVTTLVTFMHHTLPLWVAEKGGFIWPEAADRFAQYCSLVSTELGDRLQYTMTINQPNLDANLGYRRGRTYPGWIATQTMSGDEAAALVEPTYRRAHSEGRAAIRAAAPQAKVGLGLALDAWIFDGTEEELRTHRAVRDWEGDYLECTVGDDYVGVQSYTHKIAAAPSGDPEDGGGGYGHGGLPGERLTQMNYPFYPPAIGETSRRVSRLTGLPILVTENGVGTDDDNERIEYIDGALASLGEAVRDGVDLRGYFHWSLLDNFEWNSGYARRFGLIDVDRRTFKRTPKPSAAHYGAYAKRNELP